MVERAQLGFIYGQASGVPSPPPPWYGRVGVGGGAGVCGKGRGLGAGAVVLGGRPGKPFASRIPYNVARAPVD